MELEVEEDSMAPRLDLADNGGPLGVEKLHADLHKGFSILCGKQVQKSQCFPSRREIKGDNDVFAHNRSTA